MEVLRVRRARKSAASVLQSEAQETLAELDPGDVFERRLAQETLDAPLEDRLRALHGEVLHSVLETK